MNKNIKTVALLAVLSVAAVSCQKTDFAEQNATVEQTTKTIQVVYSINGEVYQVTLDESEWEAFVERMLALAREGYEVTFSGNGSFPTSQSKEKVTFVTTSEDEANHWASEMISNGYAVTISYNKTTGEYTCIAIK